MFFPFLTDTYLKIRRYLGVLTLQYGMPCSFLMFLAWRLWPIGPCAGTRHAWRSLSSIGGDVAAAILPQGKGWAYHAYPAILCA